MHPKTRRDVEESKIAECGTSDGAESSSNPIAQMVQEKVSFNSILSLAFFPRFRPIFGI